MNYYDIPLGPLTKAVATNEFALQERILILNERMVNHEYERKQRIVDEFRASRKSDSRNGNNSHLHATGADVCSSLPRRLQLDECS